MLCEALNVQSPLANNLPLKAMLYWPHGLVSTRASLSRDVNPLSKGTDLPFEIKVHIAIPGAIQDGEEEDNGADG